MKNNKYKHVRTYLKLKKINAYYFLVTIE